MTTLIDRTGWPVGQGIDYESREEAEAVRALTTQAQAFVRLGNWSMPIEDLFLAFAVGPLLGLFLLRFVAGGKPEDRERWVVVGDLPSMHFETDEYNTPALALRLYCAIAQDWADNVMAGLDLSESYPVDVAPTHEHAEMLLNRIDFIRKELVPLAG